jgi:hypothetical protein
MAWGWFIEQYVRVYIFIFDLLDGFDPRAWVDWLQLFSIPIGLFWIGYQFNRLRRRGAREFDNWVQEQTKNLRENLGIERGEYVERAYIDANSPAWWRTILMVAARTKLALQFVLRVLLLRRWKPSVGYAMTLWRAGKKDKAHAQLLAIAADLESKLPTYATLEAAKRLETQNAFLYAGLSANETVDAKSAFNGALRLSDKDVDAYKLLARRLLDEKQYVEARSSIDKLVEIGDTKRDDLLLAEGYRLQAEAIGISTQDGRQLLAKSLKLDGAHTNYCGMARTRELYGDIYFPRKGAKHYKQSFEDYERGGDWISAKRVDEKLSKLIGRETPISRMLDRLALLIQQLAMRTRARPQT